MIILGILCLILGAVFDAGILWAIGVILVVVGVIFWILGAMGRAVGGRRTAFRFPGPRPRYTPESASS